MLRAGAQSEGQILAFTTGGKLAELADADGIPLVTFPGGLQPRAAVGYAFVPSRRGRAARLAARGADRRHRRSERVLRSVRNSCNPDVAYEDNEAKQLAGGWVGKMPVIYGSQAERGVVAYRWKTQINENAKALAVSNVFPELNHNETVGWSGGRGQGEPEKNLSVVILRDDREPDQIRKRVELTKQIIVRRAAEIKEVWARGGAGVSRMLSLVYVGDFASYYLAIAYGEDPTPVRVIDWLKGELAKSD